MLVSAKSVRYFPDSAMLEPWSLFCVPSVLVFLDSIWVEYEDNFRCWLLQIIGSVAPL